MVQADQFPVETHPFEPFLPIKARVLFLGSFPPPRKRWCMDFYYPNFINDFWRIVGLVFFDDKDRFVDTSRKQFLVEEIIPFCEGKGLAFYDTASAVRRLKGNASDKFLEVVTPSDVPALLRKIGECKAVVVTGEKAAETLGAVFGAVAPGVGGHSSFTFEDRNMELYRMPSSSRAYPLSLQKKADVYRRLFEDLGMVSSP